MEVLIEVDGTYSGPCSNEHSDNYNFSYQTDTTKGKFIHSTLLSAYSMGKSVVVVGNGTCLTGNTEVERVQYVKLGGGLPGGPTNNAPTIDNPPGPQTSTVDIDIANINLTATDLDGDSFTFDDNNTLPSGINIDSSTGVISGRPTAVGSSSVVITVDDGTDSTSAPFNWTVEAAAGGGDTVLAGPGPNGADIYTTRCDAGQSWNGSVCTGTRDHTHWNDNSTGACIYRVTSGTNFTNGSANTSHLVSLDANTCEAGTQNFEAAHYCNNLNEAGFTDWYLPAREELRVLAQNQATTGNLLPAGLYWSSSQAYKFSARALDMSNPTNSKGAPVYYYYDAYIRCVRSQ